MKKKLGLIILIIILILLGYGYYKYIFVPANEIYDIKYLNLKKINASGSGNADKIELNDHGLYVRFSYVNPGDTISYSFDIVNDGTIQGQLFKKPIFWGTDVITKKFVFYTLNYEDGSEILPGDIILPGETKKVILNMDYQNPPDIATQDSSYFETTLIFLYLQNR